MIKTERRSLPSCKLRCVVVSRPSICQQTINHLSINHSFTSIFSKRKKERFKNISFRLKVKSHTFVLLTHFKVSQYLWYTIQVFETLQKSCQFNFCATKTESREDWHSTFTRSNDVTACSMQPGLSSSFREDNTIYT